MKYSDAVALCVQIISMIKSLNPAHPDPWVPQVRNVIASAQKDYGVTPLQMEKDVATALAKLEAA